MVNNKQMTSRVDNIVVVGQGAMGLLWYHHLSQDQILNSASVTVNIKNDVTLLASNQDLLSKNNLRTSSYQFTSYQQASPKSYLLTYSQIADIESADIILLCLKSFHIASKIESIAKYISPHCIVILAHNGIGTFEAVAKLLPSQQVILAMLTTHGSLRISPLTITHTGLGQSDIGLLSGELSYLQQEQLTSKLNSALPQVTFHQDIVKKQWLKLAINCVINPITALNNIDNGKVNDDNFTEQIKILLTEIIEVSQAENIDLAFTDLQAMVHKVALATESNCSSMRSDVLAGRSTEVDYINGYIHRLGKKNNVATPENTRLWQQVLNLKVSASS
ncbi:ketopantoate reductase family protein [Colwellia sp. 12G3]|uniref:ketopantoate reductase family protein n=1 Tax=Colwellia sp. 12G3 TaxID=2058299 RepID=UPI000C329ED6|nr:2-dehydropantoate 2-reductase [Colwellia sp. 12G3]PKI14192.1 2-dehydropantoate 2-reductase [Colwellia sp. 12G3]